MTNHSQDDPKEDSSESNADLSEQESVLAGDFDGLLGAHGPESPNSKTADSTEEDVSQASDDAPGREEDWSAGRLIAAGSAIVRRLIAAGSAIAIIIGGFVPWTYNIPSGSSSREYVYHGGALLTTVLGLLVLWVTISGATDRKFFGTQRIGRKSEGLLCLVAGIVCWGMDHFNQRVNRLIYPRSTLLFRSIFERRHVCDRAIGVAREGSI